MRKIAKRTRILTFDWGHWRALRDLAQPYWATLRALVASYTDIVWAPHTIWAQRKSLGTSVKNLATCTRFLWSLCMCRWKCTYFLISHLRELIFEPNNLVLLIWTTIRALCYISVWVVTLHSQICFFIFGIWPQKNLENKLSQVQHSETSSVPAVVLF